jgi:hypothetical protein
MPGIALDTAAITAAAKEAAAKLGIKDETEVVESQTTEEETTEEGEETTDEVGEEEGAEEEVVEAEEEEVEGGEKKPLPIPKEKSVPLSRFNEVYGKMRQFERALQIREELDRRERRREPEKVKEKEIELPDFEQMDEKQKALWILKAVKETVRSEVAESVGPVISDAQKQAAWMDVKETAARHKDYVDYATPMTELANRHPDLNAEEVYQLAKSLSNPGAQAKSEKEKTAKIAKTLKDKVALKKKANTERRTSRSESVSEKKEFKTVRDAGLEIAKKIGLK